MIKRLTFLFFFILSFSLAHSQTTKDTSSAFARNILNKQKEFSVGIYGGPDVIFVKPQTYTNTSFSSSASNTGKGYNLSVLTKLKLPEGLFFNSGISYQFQNYTLSQIGGSDNVPPYPGNFEPVYNDDEYSCVINSYYIGVPLSLGYQKTKARWSYHASLGIEFYYNFKNEESFYDNTKGILLKQNIVYNGSPQVNYWSLNYSPYGLISPYYSSLNAFGVIKLGLEYEVSPTFSVAFEPTLRFSNPFYPIGYAVSFADIKGLADLSLNLGVNYSLPIDDMGSFRHDDKDKQFKRIIVGFQILPNFSSSIGVSYSYGFSLQFNLATQIAIETGLAIDNSGLVAQIGIPVLAKYYFPRQENNNPFYLDLGFHIDYSDNLGYTHTLPPAIIPVPLIESGYEIKIGSTCFFDIALGYKHPLSPISLSNNTNVDNTLTSIFYSSLGFSYRL